MIVVPPWLYLAGGALALATAFGAGWQVRDWKADADMAKVERQLQQAVDEQRARADAAAADYEAIRAQLGQQSRDTRTIIEREYRNVEVPADCAVPDPVADSLRAAVESANRAAAGEPAATVP